MQTYNSLYSFFIKVDEKSNLTGGF